MVKSTTLFKNKDNDEYDKKILHRNISLYLMSKF
jgi:hypothetical protein